APAGLLQTAQAVGAIRRRGAGLVLLRARAARALRIRGGGLAIARGGSQDEQDDVPHRVPPYGRPRRYHHQRCDSAPSVRARSWSHGTSVDAAPAGLGGGADGVVIARYA